MQRMPVNVGDRIAVAFATLAGCSLSGSAWSNGVPIDQDYTTYLRLHTVLKQADARATNASVSKSISPFRWVSNF
jgi:hypothetical protein